MIRFGTMSFVLLLGAIQGAVVVVGLLRKRSNRKANLLLSGLILLLTLKLVPYIIGYAGFYDAYPWLDLAPFDMGLGIGPVLYLYISRLTLPDLPPKWKLHLLPPLLQFTIYLGLFIQPLSFKHWFELHLGDSFNAIETVLVIVSLSTYLVLTWRRYRSYETWLKDQLGNPDVHPLKHLRTMLGLVSTTLIAFVSAKIWNLGIHQLNYFQMFPFYVLLTLVVYAFGFVAFQFADVQFPVVSEPPVSKETDWSLVAATYTQQLESQTFWKDPLLSLSSAAQALETSEVRLSRAINSGLGITFSEWINRYRVEQVSARLGKLSSSSTIQELALECGFNSKASFNRWFRQVKGCTPTEFRRAQSDSSPVTEPLPVQPQYPTS